MTQYIYFVKCPSCEDEPFDFFDEAKAFALGCLSDKPIITQVEVNRNDFGECTDSCDLGTIWSWEDITGITDDESACSVFTKDDLVAYEDAEDPEFTALDNSVDFEPTETELYSNDFLDTIPDNFCRPGTPLAEDEQRLATNDKGDYLVAASSGLGYTVFNRHNVCIGGINSEDDEDAIRRFNLGDLDEACARKPIPEGMTIIQLVEELEKNEDTVECTWCNELFPKEECVYNENNGYICSNCKDSLVECTWCNDLFSKSACRYEVNLGWLCSSCEAAIKSRGETLAFKENDYWDFLDEDTEQPINENLDWHTYEITYATKANPDNDQVTRFTTWQSDVEYAWRKSNANIPYTIIKDIRLLEDVDENEPETLHDLGNDYDGGYPKETTENSFQLTLCPECGSNALDPDIEICINCGYNFA